MVTATDAESALAVLASDQVELVMVDALVERADGLSVLRELTHRRSAPPIMALPPVGEEDTVVPAPRQGGRAAAGPVPMPELLTRVDRQLARIGPAVQDPHVLRIGGLEVDVLRRTVTTPDETIRLRPARRQCSTTWAPARSGAPPRGAAARPVGRRRRPREPRAGGVRGAAADQAGALLADPDRPGGRLLPVVTGDRSSGPAVQVLAAVQRDLSVLTGGLVRLDA